MDFGVFRLKGSMGTLGSYQTNNKDIGLIIMRKFCKEVQVHSMDHSLYYNFLNKNGAKQTIMPSDILGLGKTLNISYDDNQFVKILSLYKKIALTDG